MPASKKEAARTMASFALAEEDRKTRCRPEFKAGGAYPRILRPPSARLEKPSLGDTKLLVLRVKKKGKVYFHFTQNCSPAQTPAKFQILHLLKA